MDRRLEAVRTGSLHLSIFSPGGGGDFFPESVTETGAVEDGVRRHDCYSRMDWAK